MQRGQNVVLALCSMKEMGEEEKRGRYRELKYEKNNYIILGFRKEKRNAAAAQC